jgi:hypothetical protein
MKTLLIIAVIILIAFTFVGCKHCGQWDSPHADCAQCEGKGKSTLDKCAQCFNADGHSGSHTCAHGHSWD